MPSPARQDYLKQIYLKQREFPDRLVPMGELAASMVVTSGTATSMVKALADTGMVDYSPHNGVRLTPGGEQVALQMLRKHRLVELFLVNALGLDWSEVHIEAERLEHALSDTLLERLDAFLGHPDVDPHGDPIPSAKGRMDETRLKNLAECPPGKPFRIARVVDQDPEFLRFADRHDLRPGAKVEVESRDAIADAVSLRTEGGSAVTLGSTAAAKLLVEPA
ncbi:MAG: metal-dependent transcriptional regulator [Candidatus Tectomicrobia bacterium]|nr:metal-dependent transcriptional regulator [Candidatus Tectomicrobia bacterium]